LATLKLHDDGWLALPADLRQLLALKTGDRLQAELVDGAIVLRPASAKRAPAQPELVPRVPGGVIATAADNLAAPVKRPRGRPRKVRVDPSHAELLPGREVPLAAPKRKPGRPRKVRAEEAALEPAMAPSSDDETVVWKLRPKTALPEASPDPMPDVPPPRRREPSWGSSGGEREERRPFRNVEVRKLGPGRRHNRSRQTTGS
jgi:bifunctional DNA-binding transcriptional regulator/antitoxin component of YhaV-PrlF toxin-antitoxin module